jgi:two-component system, cell cycle sensor histidine kinase and response regulator CckA
MSDFPRTALEAAAFRHSSGLQAIVDDDGVIRAANEAWTQFSEQFADRPAACGVGANYFAVCRTAAERGEAAATRVLNACHDTLRDGITRELEYECDAPLPPDTTPGYWYRLRVAPLSPGMLLIEHTDISEREIERHRVSRAAFQLHVLEAIAQPVIATDALGVVTYWNDAATQLFGYTAQEAVGRNITDVTVPEASREQADEIMQALTSGQQWTGEFWVRHRDGTRFPARVTDIPMVDDHGNILGIVGVTDDLRPQYAREAEQMRLRGLEAQLLQRQKMEALGTVVGGVAHEFNNVLAAILGNAELMRDEFTVDHEGRTVAESIVEASQRARDVVRALLTFARPQSREMQTLVADTWIRSALRLIEPVKPADVALTVHLAAGGTTIRGNATQLTQMLLNLASNATYAMRECARRELSIRSYLERPGSGADVPPRGWVVIEVADTGNGMSEATKARIFDPFFTTKPVGDGSGLGLALVHGLVTAHHGAIDVETAEGAGTTIRVRFPVTDTAAEPVAVPPSTPRDTARGNILLVDDERLVLGAITRILERAGYTVVSYTDPEEALAMVRPDRHAPCTFSAAILDYAMPRLRGDELARRLEAAGFRAPVLLCTGNATEVGPLPPLVKQIVEKPVSGADLVKLLSTVAPC